MVNWLYQRLIKRKTMKKRLINSVFFLLTARIVTSVSNFRFNYFLKNNLIDRFGLVSNFIECITLKGLNLKSGSDIQRFIQIISNNLIGVKRNIIGNQRKNCRFFIVAFRNVLICNMKT